MCTFITATINEGADLKVIEHLLARHREGFDVIETPPIQHLLPHDRIYLVHQGHCDCGTGVGRGYSPDAPEKDMKRLKRKGWSEAKIHRWYEEAFKVADRQRPAVHNWLDIIGEVLATPTVTTFGLMHSYYKTYPTTEVLEVSVAPPLSIQEAEPKHLYGLLPRTLQEFVW